MRELADQIARWLKDQVEQARARGIVLGLSGGVDSAVVAALSKQAVGDDVLGLVLPCQSSPDDEEDAGLVARAVGIEHVRVLSKLCRATVTAGRGLIDRHR